MDLDYPSEKRNELSRQLNQVDRRYGSIILSNPKIVMPVKPLCEKLKKKVLDHIYYNEHIKLVRLLNQHSLSLLDELSKQGHGWTILHYICKNNSTQCLDLCLRWLYQTDPTSYESTLNQRNCDGDTPLIVGCLYKANSCLRTMLQYGGVDIYAVNGKKLSAYQIALSSLNQEALQMLMKYELKVKRKSFVNKDLLGVQLPDLQAKTFQRVYDWFIECFYFGKSQSEIQPIKGTETDRKMMKKDELSQSIPQIQIYWSQPQKVHQKKLPLFSTISQPFLLKQSNIIVSNMLIVFQALAEHPELLKRIISSAEDKYYVRFEGRTEERLVWVDNLFPYFVDTKEPLFLALDDQLWPMVLQKALSQFYNGYFEPGKIPVHEMIETISGNQSFTIPLNAEMNTEQKQKIKCLIMKIQSKNCILVLQPSQNCLLKPEEGRIESFSLIKILGDKFLVNCPFSFSDQKRDQKSSRQMKLLQAHYNNPSCTTVWLDTQEFFLNFSSLIFCHTLNTPQLKPHPIKVHPSQNRAYLVIKLKERSENDRIFLAFKNREGRTIIPVKCSAWSVIGAGRECVEKVCCELVGLVELTGVGWATEVLVLCEFEEKQGQGEGIIAVCRTEEAMSVQALDCTIGDLEFIECCKKYFRQNYQQYSAPIIQIVGEYVLAMAASPEPCYIPLPISLSEQNVVEGMFVGSESKLEMFEYGSIYFAVLNNVEAEVARNLKIVSYETPKGEENMVKLQIQSV